jgi:hypothetical protein
MFLGFVHVVACVSISFLVFLVLGIESMALHMLAHTLLLSFTPSPSTLFLFMEEKYSMMSLPHYLFNLVVLGF